MVKTLGKQHVYIRSSWSDDWEEVADLFCEEAVWCASPSIPTATLQWHYGDIAPVGALTFGEVLKRDSIRHYVRILFQLEEIVIVNEEEETEELGFAERFWHGVIELDEDMHLGEVTDPLTLNTVATGEQVFTAYGMEHLLDRQFVNHSFFDADGEGDIQRLERALTFNHRVRSYIIGAVKGNRSAGQSGGTHHFANDLEYSNTWSTRDIVEYLLRYFSPRDAADAVTVPFELHTGVGTMFDCVPDWDDPQLDAENRSVYSLLTSLIPRQRLVSFYSRVIEEEGGDVVELVPFSFSDVAVATLEGESHIPANNRPKTLLFGKDQTAEATVKQSTVEKYEQVIVRGARRRSVFMGYFTASIIDKGWTESQEIEYETGASGIAGYDALAVEERRRRNAEARSRDSLRNVFSRFVIPDDWDGLAIDGDGGVDFFPVFPDTTHFYKPGFSIEQTLPLLEGVDYSGEVDDVDETTSESGVELPPIVLWERPDNGHFVNVEKLADNGPLLNDEQDDRWSGTVTVPRQNGENGRAIQIRVSGAPQHVLAWAASFDPLPDDETCGDHDWRSAAFILSALDERYAESRYPADDDLGPFIEGDYVQRLVIDAGEQYRLDYIIPGTAVGSDENGEVLYSNGGYIHDDRDKLTAIAKLAHAWYSRTRRILYFATDQLTSELEIGDMVMEVGQPDIDLEGGHNTFIRTPITELRIQQSWGTTDAPPDAPRMRLVTDAGQLDPLAIAMGSPPEPLPAKPAILLRDVRVGSSPDAARFVIPGESEPQFLPPGILGP